MNSEDLSEEEIKVLKRVCVHYLVRQQDPLVLASLLSKGLVREDKIEGYVATRNGKEIVKFSLPKNLKHDGPFN